MTKTQEKMTYKGAKRLALFPAGDHKAERNRKDSMTNTKHQYHVGSTKEHHLGMAYQATKMTAVHELVMVPVAT